MLRRIALLCALAVGACQDAPTTAPVASTPAPRLAVIPGSDIIPGQFIVTLREGNDPAAVAREYGVAPRFVYQHALVGFAGSISDAARSGLLKDGRVVRVEQDRVMHAFGTESPTPSWGLDRVDQHALPLDNSYSYGTDGTGVTAYIIDTGILVSHTDFGGRASVGYDAVGDGRNGIDCAGHGTHVAGTVGGTKYGIAKGVKLVAVRVLDCSGSGTTSGVVAGVDWVTNNHASPAVANMSLGGGLSSTLDNAVQNSISSGVAYAIAAGNGNSAGVAQDACSTSPADVAAAMTVSATDNTDTKASWANYGNCVDWFAPGVSITSDYYTSTTATATMSGTSMATPHTTGVAALVRARYPSLTPAAVRDTIFANLTKGVVHSASTTNNHLLYSLIGTGSTAPNQPPVASFTYACSGLSCNFTDQSTDPDGTIAARSWNFGDGATSTAQNPSHSYSAAGTYTVTEAVTDNAGATSSSSQSVTVSAPTPPPPSSITLSVSGTRARNGMERASLSWSGASGSSVDIYRNGSRITTANNSGSYTDNLGKAGPGTWTYQVCQAGSTAACSNSASVTF